MKPENDDEFRHDFRQPPSGGCVLKHFELLLKNRLKAPAAFGRLCVETRICCVIAELLLPAAFGRLCVETRLVRQVCYIKNPAAFGRLCVETQPIRLPMPSAIPAAFGRLCVETFGINWTVRLTAQPPSGGCVLKLCPRKAFPRPNLPAAFGRLCVETT